MTPLSRPLSRPMKATLAALAAAALCLGPAITAEASAPASPPTPTGSGTWQGGCYSGDWRGDAVVKWAWNDGRFVSEIVRYKIRKDPWGSGGNKANVDLGLDTLSESGWIDEGWSHSADSMKQDDVWHDLGLAFPARDGHLAAKTTVRFTFDRSGESDPSCRATFTTGPTSS